jgi:tetratricopeptide (TPR) repeat protein
MEYDKACFIIMPFGEKPVGERMVDFDRIYHDVLVPAVSGAALPEGGSLEPRRTDKDFFSGDISVEMFHYLEYSRIALADISGLNPNVFYELGVRHRAREAGTVIVRQADAPIPFDINKIKAFSYDPSPERRPTSIELIADLLKRSLERNRLDSPVQGALKVQREIHPDIEGLLREAENAMRFGDRGTAVARYRTALRADPGNALVRFKLGLLLKESGDWKGALEEFELSTRFLPGYAEAWREKGIAENKIAQQAGYPPDLPDGEDALRRAIERNPDDFDALASLGGVLKRKGRWAEALKAYRGAREVSGGHSYPLLNEIKVQGRLQGALHLDGSVRRALTQAARARAVQVAADPPYDAPWSFFDLAEVRLYQGEPEAFISLVERGLEHCDADWQPATFRYSLQLLVDGGVELEGLREGIALLGPDESPDA